MEISSFKELAKSLKRRKKFGVELTLRDTREDSEYPIDIFEFRTKTIVHFRATDSFEISNAEPILYTWLSELFDNISETIDSGESRIRRYPETHLEINGIDDMDIFPTLSSENVMEACILENYSFIHSCLTDVINSFHLLGIPKTKQVDMWFMLFFILIRKEQWKRMKQFFETLCSEDQLQYLSELPHANYLKNSYLSTLLPVVIEILEKKLGTGVFRKRAHTWLSEESPYRECLERFFLICDGPIRLMIIGHDPVEIHPDMREFQLDHVRALTTVTQGDGVPGSIIAPVNTLLDYIQLIFPDFVFSCENKETEVFVS